ncbi:hypothetical protein [Halothermothrix orenii]|uniref:Uncharacterized protein n=1 Tax=Halothermothrix orenii (strain H 168 / OCM 544 / DSM 9562) TaxID=373903 RepID=B8CXN4_HALOH|nr:hypothetical protein [Halothermothrix orenii]ACL70053.1 hypothetical protein Hore_13030 [Halothermothrix orenii H 168]
MKIRFMTGIKLFVEWITETFIFILLPLIIHLGIMFVFRVEFKEYLKLLDWMIITIILFGDITKKLLNKLNNENESSYMVKQALFLGIFLIIISSVILGILIASYYNEGFNPGKVFYFIQFILFGLSLIYSAYIKIWLGLNRNKRKKYIPEQAN